MLQRQLRTAFVDTSYGILTRAGGEAAWRRMRRQPLAVIFTDLDGLHALNERLGYAEVNRRIASALRSRRDDLSIAMRWFSGDEIVVVVPQADGLKTAERLLAALHTHDLSGTFAVVAASTHDLAAEAGRAGALVQAAKRAGQRGIIIDGDAQ
jgi:GGDEF domain-containing protein